MGIDDSNIKRNIERALTASDEEVGPACVNIVVPPTIDNTESFREAYVQGYRHALADVRKYLKKECVHGHTERQVGCVSCVLVFDKPFNKP